MTDPLAQRFTELDELGRNLYGFALLTATAAIIAFLTPTALHRLGSRHERSSRLQWSIRMTRSGIILLGAALLLAVTTTFRFVFAPAATAVAIGGLAVLLGSCWLVLPLALRRHR